MVITSDGVSALARTRLISLSGSASQAGGYPVDHVTVSACKTRGQSAVVADSGEYWMDEEAEPVSCECGGSTSEFVVSFSLHPDGDAVRMICAGVCCLSDG